MALSILSLSLTFIIHRTKMMHFRIYSHSFICDFQIGKNLAMPSQVLFYKSGNNSKNGVSSTRSNSIEISNPGLARPLSIAPIIAAEQPTFFPG